MKAIIAHIKTIEHGFKHIIEAGDSILKDEMQDHLALSINFLADESYQKRAVIEGLRIWTGRPYFKEHPKVAIHLISAHRSADSDYLRKSVGNALRDIGKKHPAEVSEELSTWNLEDKRTFFTYKLAKGSK